jgi:DNA helicase HerA-like ATPase
MIEIGRVIGTEKRPNTAYTFYFWGKPDAGIGIGSLVRVEAESTIVWGVVVEAEGFNDLESPLHEFLSVGGDATKQPPTNRPEMRVFEAAVLRRDPDEPVGAVPIGKVFVASEKDVQMALRVDEYLERFGIPCGAYGPADDLIGIYLDSRYLLGPEAGHLNVTGTSGLASKTSFILFLLSSIFQRNVDLPEMSESKGVAALLFNVKGGDLLYLDRDPSDAEGAEGLSELDEKIYTATGIKPGPFERVQYYAPFDDTLTNLATLRRNEELNAINPSRAFSFGLEDVIKHVEVLLNRDDLDAKADAYLQYLNDKAIKESAKGINIGGELRLATSLTELCQIVHDQLEQAQGKNEQTIESHSAFTVRKVYNRLYNLERRFRGLIARDGKPLGPLTAPFEAGTIYVVDVAALSSEEQDLVFAATITRLREQMEQQRLGVGRLVVMIDELNKYAPSGSGETYVLKALREISSRGRYLGLTLFGAQQFRSRVDKEIVGNAATHAFGHIEAEELAQPGYSYFSPAVKEKLGALPQGQVLLKHPHFTQPIFLRFPRPSVMKGQDGMRRYRQSDAKSVREVIFDTLRRWPNVDFGKAGDLISRMPEDEQITALHRLERAQPGQDPLAAFAGLKVVAPVKEASSSIKFSEEDPFSSS